MYTECPDCQTYFKITPEQLKAAEGKVRCGNCNHVFNALTHLADKVPSSDIPDPSMDVADSANVAADALPVEIDEPPESVVAFQVSDPESEAALSEISLPITAESMSLDADNIADEAALTLEGMSALSAIDELEKSKESQFETPVSKVGAENVELSGISDAELSVVISQLDDALVETNVSSVNTDLSELSGLISSPVDDVSSEKVEKKEAPASITSNAQSALSEFVGEEEISRVALSSASESFADVDVPGIEEATEDSLEDINKDIDNALDNLFEDEPEIEKPTSAVLENPLVEETPISDINNLSGLGEFENVEKQKNSQQNKMDFDLSDSEPEATSKVGSGFDLEDSFLLNEPLKSEAVDWEPYDNSNAGPEAHSGDKFKLEELTHDKQETRGGYTRIIWIVVIVVLLVVLLGQFAYLKRESLVQYPTVRSVLVQACAVINLVTPCEVPTPRNLEAIEIVERNVVDHPSAKNALLITSTINNKAEFDQQFPELVLTFSDINQKMLARRTFKPEEYLAEGVDIDEGMKIQVPIKIMLEIVDPGEAAVNFTFDFK